MIKRLKNLKNIFLFLGIILVSKTVRAQIGGISGSKLGSAEKVSKLFFNIHFQKSVCSCEEMHNYIYLS